MEATARRLAALSPLGDAHAAGLALICLRRGHTDEALARFEALARRGFADLPRDMTYVWCLTLLATLCVALGDVGRAAKLYDALAPYQGRCAVAAGAVTCAERSTVIWARSTRPPGPPTAAGSSTTHRRVLLLRRPPRRRRCSGEKDDGLTGHQPWAMPSVDHRPAASSRPRRWPGSTRS